MRVRVCVREKEETESASECAQECASVREYVLVEEKATEPYTKYICDVDTHRHTQLLHVICTHAHACLCKH